MRGNEYLSVQLVSKTQISFNVQQRINFIALQAFDIKLGNIKRNSLLLVMCNKRASFNDR